jgi:hypothetical protein
MPNCPIIKHFIYTTNFNKCFVKFFLPILKCAKQFGPIQSPFNNANRQLLLPGTMGRLKDWPELDAHAVEKNGQRGQRSGCQQD